jgi:hypothetical protein
MTRTRLLLGALVLVACGARTEGLDRTKLPEELKSDYDVFARRCSKCHSLARPLQSGITDDEQWILYVNRMRRQPGSGIDYTDQERILRFLKYYAADLRAKEAAKKGVPSAPPDASAPPTPVQGPASADEPKDGG